MNRYILHVAVLASLTQWTWAATVKPHRRDLGNAPLPVNGIADAKPLVTSGKVTGGPVLIRTGLKGIKKIHLVVTDGGDGKAGDLANWIEPVFVKTDGSRVKLTSLTPMFASTGEGTVWTGRNGKDGFFKVNKQPFIDGIGVHAPSVLTFGVPPSVLGFQSRVAIDDAGAESGTGSVEFMVFSQLPPASLFAPPIEAATAGPAAKVFADKPYGFAAAKASFAKEFKAASGLSASLVAAEPMIQNPTNLDVDHRGRIWAVEAVNYRSTFKDWKILREEGDRVVILEDTNNDGLPDKESTFWQSTDLQAPLGICVLPAETGTQVIVSAAPNVWLLTDADGDDKAEKVDLLFKVGGKWDHDHEVHAFVFGADGKFYFNFGNEGRMLQWPDGTVVKDVHGKEITEKGDPFRQGMVFRCEIDLKAAKASQVEVLGHNFRNNYEVCVDSFLTMWQSDNDDDGNKGVRINYVMDYGNFGYTDEKTGAGWRTQRTNLEAEIPLQHWHLNDPGVVPNLLQTGSGSPTGILFNEGTALGKKLQNAIIHCDAGPRVVRAYLVKASGAGYKAEVSDILNSEDPWFRPSDVALAPDGSLIISDWYDAGVGGHHMADHEKGKIRGRIYRVAATGQKSGVTKPDFATAAGAATALRSPNHATRFRAWQALAAMGPRAEADLKKLWADTNPRMRARSISLLAKLDADKILSMALNDPDPDIRMTGIRMGRQLAQTDDLRARFPQCAAAAQKMVLGEADQRVNRELAISCRILQPLALRADAWAYLAGKHDGVDRWYLEALGIGAAGNEDLCFDAFALPSTDWNLPANNDVVWRLRTNKAAPILAKLAQTKETIAPLRYMRAFDFMPDGEAKTAALNGLATSGEAPPAIAVEAALRLRNQDLKTNPALKMAVEKLIEATRGSAAFVALVRDFQLSGHGDGLLQWILKEPGSPDAMDAARLLLTKERPTLDAALAGPDAAKVLDVLGAVGSPESIAVLMQRVRDETRPPADRHSVIRALLRSQTGVRAILTGARDGSYPKSLQTLTAQSLASVQFPSMQKEISELFPMAAPKAGEFPGIKQLAEMPGDVERGKAVFAKAESTCMTCHRIGNVGVNFGPGLGEIGSKLAREALFESIISPNAGVSMGYETTQITLKSKDTVIGIVQSETAKELVLGLPGGAQNRVAVKDIVKREKLPNSLMPSGIQQLLKTQELVDLVAYLASLKAPAGASR